MENSKDSVSTAPHLIRSACSISRWSSKSVEFSCLKSALHFRAQNIDNKQKVKFVRVYTLFTGNRSPWKAEMALRRRWMSYDNSSLSLFRQCYFLYKYGSVSHQCSSVFLFSTGQRYRPLSSSLRCHRTSHSSPWDRLRVAILLAFILHIFFLLTVQCFDWWR